MGLSPQVKMYMRKRHMPDAFCQRRYPTRSSERCYACPTVRSSYSRTCYLMLRCAVLCLLGVLIAPTV
jgi:hypothetical protein